MRRFWPRKFWNRYPLVDYWFVFRGEESRKTFEYEITANIESQAIEEAREWLERVHGEPMTCIIAQEK